MKRAIFIVIFIIGAVSNLIYAQETTTANYQAPVPARQNYINSGFYFQLGPVFPQGEYAQDKYVPRDTITLPILGAKIGAALDLGFLVYIGPSFANKHIRLGIDATFLSLWYNSTKPKDPTSVTDHYYLYAGQKFGPVITINPIDRLMIDLSYKINANLAYHFGEWHAPEFPESSYSKYGANLTQSEFSLAVRYLIMKFAVQYNYGKMKYDNFDKARPSQTIQANTLRIMVGLYF
jgi:hypothetical protein